MAIAEVAYEHIVAQRVNHEPRLGVVRQAHERVILAGFGPEQVARFEVALLLGEEDDHAEDDGNPNPDDGPLL